LYSSPYLTDVAALPCETAMFQKSYKFKNTLSKDVVLKFFFAVVRNKFLQCTQLVYIPVIYHARSCKIALYMVLLSDVVGDTASWCPHVKNTRTWLPTLLYTLLQRIAFKAITFSTSRGYVIAVHVCSGKIHVNYFL